MFAGTFLPPEAGGHIDPDRDDMLAPLMEALKETSVAKHGLACLPGSSWREILCRSMFWPSDRDFGYFALVKADSVHPYEDWPDDPANLATPYRMDLKNLANAEALAIVPQKWSKIDLKRLFLVRNEGEWRYAALRAPDDLIHAIEYASQKIGRETSGMDELRQMRFLFVYMPLFLCAFLNAGEPEEKEGGKLGATTMIESYPLFFCTKFLVECRKRALAVMGGGNPAACGINGLEGLLKDIGLVMSLPNEPIEGAKTGRNDPCLCGSGKKYKKCHMKMFD